MIKMEDNKKSCNCELGAKMYLKDGKEPAFICYNREDDLDLIKDDMMKFSDRHGAYRDRVAKIEIIDKKNNKILKTYDNPKLKQ